MVAVAVAAGYLVAALLAALAGGLGASVVSPWLPLHLALAGGASTAIAGVMPFFVAALAAGAPAPSRLRKAAVGFVAVGAALVAVRGIAPGEAWAWAPVVGGWLYLTGILWLALAVRAAGRKGLMVRRPIVSLGYTLALVNVAVGGVLGMLFLAGWTPILERWGAAAPGPRVDQPHRVRVAGHRRDAAPLPADRPGRADRPAPERGDRGARDRDGHAGRGRGPARRLRARGRWGSGAGGARGTGDRPGGGTGRARREAAGRPIPAGTGSRPWGCSRGWPGSSSVSRWLPGCWCATARRPRHGQPRSWGRRSSSAGSRRC